MIGKQFHYLTVIKELERIYYKTTSTKQYLCKCKCGKEIKSTPSNLNRGATKSCGCWKKESAKNINRTHGMSKSPEYQIWAGMVKRCYNKNHKDFHIWGGKGITVCDSWLHDFAQFYADMGKRPSPIHSIDRIDNNKQYMPENCRWATPKEQAFNTEKTHKVEYQGQLVSLRNFANLANLDYYALYNRHIRKNIPLHEAIKLVPSKNSALRKN